LSQPSSNVNRMVAEIIAAGAGKTITNAGVFDALTAGNLMQKTDFAGIVLGIGDSIEFTFDLTWS